MFAVRLLRAKDDCCVLIVLIAESPACLAQVMKDLKASRDDAQAEITRERALAEHAVTNLKALYIVYISVHSDTVRQCTVHTSVDSPQHTAHIVHISPQCIVYTSVHSTHPNPVYFYPLAVQHI